MKSVLLHGIEARAQNDAGEATAVSEGSSEAAAMTTREQLAELELLSRVECETTAESQRGAGDAGPPPERRDTARVDKSTFTALLGMSKALASRQQPPAPPLSIVTRPCLSSSSSSSVPASSAPSMIAPGASPRGTTERLRRGSTLPTLSEESIEDAAAPVEVDGDDEVVQDFVPADRNECQDQAISELKSSHDDAVVPQANECDRESPEGDHDDDEEDDAFTQMLSQLSGDFELLTLAMTDLTARRLAKVHAVLLCGEDAPTAVTSDGEPETTDERVETSESRDPRHHSPRSQMRHIRTAIAVDTLRMMLERHGQERVCREIASVIRHVFDSCARDSGVEPLHHAPAVLTSRNIARVVLLTRQALAHEGVHPPRDQLQTNSSQHSRVPSSPSRHQQRHQQQQTRSPAHKSPRGAPSSKRAMESNRPLSPHRRSILASEGHHVLMQEKISSFQFRGTSTSGLSLFKVRRDGAAEIEAAATRRRKSVTYSKEQARKAGSSERESEASRCAQVNQAPIDQHTAS